MTSEVILRPARPDDLSAASAICFHAFQGISNHHRFTPDFPSLEAAAGVMSMVLNASNVRGVVAEIDGKVVGSNFLWEGTPIAGVGPITVDPQVQERSVGRRLMEHVLEIAREKSIPSVRLVQAAFNARSMSLYTKLGFDVREPLVCMQGSAIRATIHGHHVRHMTEGDVGACCDLCFRVHGHDRRADVTMALSQGSPNVVESGRAIVGYDTGIGFFAHAVARDNAALMALIAAAETFSGPGFLLPSRNAELFRWCLENGLRVVQPMMLMSRGLYNEPRGAFLPSILY